MRQACVDGDCPIISGVSRTLTDRIQRALRAHQTAEDPLAALDAARVLREEAERLERRAVEGVRAAGTSWSKIGGLYGLTKQGAQQRFRKGPPAAPGPTHRRARQRAP